MNFFRKYSMFRRSIPLNNSSEDILLLKKLYGNCALTTLQVCFIYTSDLQQKNALSELVRSIKIIRQQKS